MCRYETINIYCHKLKECMNLVIYNDFDAFRMYMSAGGLLTVMQGGSG